MTEKEKKIGKSARKYWEERNLPALVKMCPLPKAGEIPEVLFYAGLAYHALNKKREAIECWRKASDLNPKDDRSLRALAFELADKDPVDAAELFYLLIGMQCADADDLTALGEICLKQDRLGEAKKWLDQALNLGKDNSLALLAMATLYAHVRNRDLTLEFLRKTAATEDMDLSDLASDPEFEFLWNDGDFKKIIHSDQD